jgi:lipid-A-disaccharide synthase-like uncharacterized protein
VVLFVLLDSICLVPGFLFLVWALIFISGHLYLGSRFNIQFVIHKNFYLFYIPHLRLINVLAMLILV